jgi:hypothetical protein
VQRPNVTCLDAGKLKASGQRIEGTGSIRVARQCAHILVLVHRLRMLCALALSAYFRYSCVSLKLCDANKVFLIAACRWGIAPALRPAPLAQCSFPTRALNLTHSTVGPERGVCPEEKHPLLLSSLLALLSSSSADLAHTSSSLEPSHSLPAAPASLVQLCLHPFFPSNPTLPFRVFTNRGSSSA